MVRAHILYAECLTQQTQSSHQLRQISHKRKLRRETGKVAKVEKRTASSFMKCQTLVGTGSQPASVADLRPPATSRAVAQVL